MSASRKKKERQGDLPLTDKQRKQQHEAAVARRNKILYTILGIVLAVAVAVLLVWDSGVIQKNAVAATIGGKDYTVAEVDYYYNQTKNNFINTAESYKQQLGYDIFGYDTSLSPAQQTYSTDSETGEVTTYADFFKESALQNIQQIAALCAAAEAEGYTLSEEAQASLEAQNAQIDELATQYGQTRQSILKSLYGSYVTENSFLENLKMVTLASDYQAAFQSSIDTSDSALDAYYQDNKAELDSYTYRYASIKGSTEATTDAEGNPVEATDEEKAAAKADAETRAKAMLAAVQDGGDFDAIAKDYVSELDVDTYSTEGYTLRSNINGSTLSSIYKQWLQDSGRKEGDVEMFEDTANNGYVLVEYVSQGRNDTATVNVRHILVKPVGDAEDATEFTDEQWAAAEDKARELLTQFMAGEKTGEAFGKLAEEHSEDGRNQDGSLASAGGLYSNIGPTSSYVEPFLNWCVDAGRAVGDTGLVQTEYGWHVMYFDGVNEPTWKNTAQTALVNEKLASWMEEKLEGYDIVEASGMAHVG